MDPTPTTPITKQLPFNIGADPEFLFFHGTKALDASEILTNFLSNQPNIRKAPANNQGQNLGFAIENLGEIGWDGAASVGELRPTPSHGPADLTEKIRQLITIMYSKLPALDITTLSIGHPIGGHIHIEIDRNKAYQDKGERITSQKMAELNRIEKLIATYLMPIIASEHRLCSNGRLTATKYGKADDFRWENRSDTKATIELRGISAEWLTSPKIANATLAYTAVITHEIFNRNQELIKENFILRTKNHISSMQELMLLDYNIIEKSIVNNIKRTVKNFEFYPLFKEEIDYILKPQEVLKEKTKYGWNMVNGWQLNKNKKQPTKKALYSNHNVTSKLNKENQVLIQRNFDIPYNDDYNVTFFAKAITDRIAALNWNLKYEYFLYGLKKGIEGYSAMDCQTTTFFQIPTNTEHTNIQNAAQKMSEKFEQCIGNAVKIDPKTGKIRQWGKNQIVIGIPYEPRTKNDTTTLIDLIWQIENNKIKAQKISNFATPAIAITQPPKSTEDIINKAAQKVGTTNKIPISHELIENERTESIPNELLERNNIRKNLEFQINPFGIHPFEIFTPHAENNDNQLTPASIIENNNSDNEDD
ncbi:MAG: hypothetical protein Q7R33_01385 [Nitrosarchaeum sp.]|nr:hypothetical protein [Nitrosarchaeum sp.]